MTITTNPDDLFNLLSELNITFKTTSHAPHHSVEEAKQLRGTLTGDFTKNLFLKDKKQQLHLVTALEDQATDLKQLAKELYLPRLSFANPEILMQTLGVVPGSVTPFALMNDQTNIVSLILDKAMRDSSELNFHPLTNTKTTTISYHNLLKFLQHTGHQPRLVKF